MWVKSGYVPDGGRLELGRRLEVAGAIVVWRRKSSHLVRESGRASWRSGMHAGWVGFEATSGEEAERVSGRRCRGLEPEAGKHSENSPAPSSLMWMGLRLT